MSPNGNVRRPGDPIHSLDKAVFLAGPTPRDADTLSWRPSFIEMLHQHASEQVIYVPEGDLWLSSYDGQVAWEWEALTAAAVVLFWIPRALPSMPAFTTNMELGLMLGLGRKVVLGWPPEAKKVGYLKWHADRLGIPVHTTPKDTVESAIANLRRA